MTAIRKSHFDSASVHDIIGNHGGIHVSKNPFTKILDEERVRKSCSNCDPEQEETEWPHYVERLVQFFEANDGRRQSSEASCYLSFS